MTDVTDAAGTQDSPLRVAIVGSGPSGFYAAEALMKISGLSVRIDMFDRLPTPFGLVRGGVAPDHQKMKNVIAVYDRIASAPGFRFFGNVTLGKDILVEELRAHYHQIVYAVGNESDRRLGIPGEDLVGSYSATAFVGWYNAHPDWRGMSFDLERVERVAIVGVGNVAMDVARILAEDPMHLAPTDIAEYAVTALKKSWVREIWLLGRRGPAQAAFSPNEIRELGDLESASLVVRAEDLAAEDSVNLTGEARRNVEYLKEVSSRGEGERRRKLRLRFLVSPAEILGDAGRVTGLRIERNELIRKEDGSVASRGTGEFETLPVELVLRSVGYRGVAIQGVPFDERDGRIPNDAGRVLTCRGGTVSIGEYVVGWAKRGPTGLIGTNRGDAAATVALMNEDRAAGRTFAPEPSDAAVLRLLRERGARHIDFAEWRRLDLKEIARGKAGAKIREKYSTVDEMLEALRTRETP